MKTVNRRKKCEIKIQGEGVKKTRRKKEKKVIPIYSEMVKSTKERERDSTGR